jgi:hypothetical protein
MIMGVPQPTGNPVSTQESISNVLTSVSAQQDELEKRLEQLRDRLQSVGPQAHGQATAVAGNPGLVSHAMSIRNASARCLNLVNELEALL